MRAPEIVLPGGVDMHVHGRDPGNPDAETFASLTEAALAGGVAWVVDMPNNPGIPTIDEKALQDKMNRIEENARTDVGVFFGALPNEELVVGSREYNELVQRVANVRGKVFGLKLYCDITTGSDHRHGANAFRPIVRAWREANPDGLVLAHTEGAEATEEMLDLVARENGLRVHIPHISKKEELEAVMSTKRYRARRRQDFGKVTTGVCPHHLFLTEADVPRLGWYGRMKPSLGTEADRDFLRDNLDWIDVVETDHAPHTRAAKDNAQLHNPDGEVGTGKPTCFGVPGLEAMLPLLLQGELEGWITREQIARMTSLRPAQILGLRLPSSRVYLTNEQYGFSEAQVKSQCGWTPYKDMPVVGRVQTVIVGNTEKVVNGKVIARPGDGSVLMPMAR